MATFKIQIPKPCNESWDQMTPFGNARFCDSCAKSVVDFTTMLPNEIQHYFTENKDQRICGRFKNTQLDSIIIQIPNTTIFSQTQYHKMFLLALFIAMGTTLFSCSDKNGNKQKIDKVEVVEDSKIESEVKLGESTLNSSDSLQNKILAKPLSINNNHFNFNPTNIKINKTISITTGFTVITTEPVMVKTADTIITGDTVIDAIDIDSTKTKHK